MPFLRGNHPEQGASALKTELNEIWKVLNEENRRRLLTYLAELAGQQDTGHNPTAAAADRLAEHQTDG